jgi:aminopeptidase-like protein
MTAMSGTINVSNLPSVYDAVKEGAELYRLVSELYPICRSITGNGVRESLRLLQCAVPLSLHEVPSGTKVFDWVVPPEWNIRDAFIKNSRGEKVVDFHKSNLHVVNYSLPVRKKMTLAELRPHLFSLPDSPEWIPYRTSYYKETWGFCLTHNQLENLTDGEYEVCIDSTLEPGHLTYGEFLIKGATEAEVLISAHCCHPSLANDNLSGMAVAARLAHHLSGSKLRYTYRFIWAPGTIGSITWLALNESWLGLNRSWLPKIKHGLVLSCVGDPGRFTYKKSRFGNADVDQLTAHVLQHSGHEFQLLDFSPIGYDERQYCSPGINLPVGCFMRTPNGKYPQYHTSADDLSLVKPSSLAESLEQLLQIVSAMEDNRTYVNLNPKCEPQLGRRGLFRQMGGTKNPAAEEALLWVLNFSDGSHSLLDIATRSGLSLAVLATAARQLNENGLLNENAGIRQ